MINSGSVAPGTSPGTLTVTGSFTQDSSSTLEIDITGTATYDIVAVGVDADVAGVIDVVLGGGHGLSGSETFDIVVTTTGTLTDSGIALDAGDTSQFSLSVVEGVGGYVRLTYIGGGGGLDGDYNENGIIDAADYTVWRDNLGSTIPNDPTGGVATEADYDYWKAHFGETAGAGSGSGASAVPEPSSLCLALLAMLAMGLGSRRR